MKSPKTVECAVIIPVVSPSFDLCSHLNRLLVAGMTRNKRKFARAYLAIEK